MGCSPWGREESDTTERLHFHFSLSCTEKGNGNRLQCSCLENPRDGGAWWAAVYGAAQSRTRLKRLSSSSNSSSKDTVYNQYAVLCLVTQSCLTLRPHGLQPARLLCPREFSRQGHWSGLPSPPPRDLLPNPGIESRSSTLQVDSLPSEPPGKSMNIGVGSACKKPIASSQPRNRTRTPAL